MGRRVRHIRARPGEYVKIHRPRERVTHEHVTVHRTTSIWENKEFEYIAWGFGILVFLALLAKGC